MLSTSSRRFSRNRNRKSARLLARSVQSALQPLEPRVLMTTWTQTNFPTTTGVGTGGILDASDGIYVATNNDPNSGNSGVYFSSDQGATWTTVGTGLPTTNSLAFITQASDGTIIVAENRGVGYQAYALPQGNHSAAWVSTGLPSASQGVIGFGKDSKGNVICSQGWSGHLFRFSTTTDQFTQYSTSFPDDMFCLVTAEDGKLYAGAENDGLFYSSDDGMTWTQVYNTGSTRAAAPYTGTMFTGGNIGNAVINAAGQLVADPNDQSHPSVWTLTGPTTWTRDNVQLGTSGNNEAIRPYWGDMMLMPDGNMYADFFLDPGWTDFTYPRVQISTDGGADWSDFTSGIVPQPFDVNFKSRDLSTGPDGELWFGSNEGVFHTGFIGGAPNAPSSLTASAGASSITLNWSDNSTNETGFYVFRSTTSGSGFTQLTELGRDTTSFTDTTVSSGTTYYYYVESWDRVAASAQSNTANATVGSSAPNAPSNLVATAGTSTISLTWTDNSTNENGFHVWRSTTSGSGFTTIATPGVNVTSYTDTTASTGITYYYYVTAFNGGGDSAHSNTANATISSGSTPNAPSNLIALPHPSTIALSWTDNSSNETGFHVYRSTASGSMGSIIASPTAASYTDSTPVAGTTYYYTVTAYISGGGESSGVVCSTATLTVYEGFNYTAGNGTNWNGHDTGDGLGANWTLTNTTNATVASGSLTYTSSGHSLSTSANSATLTNSDKATGTLSSSIGAAGTTIWIGFELNTHRASTSVVNDAEILLNTTGTPNGLRLGVPQNNLLGARVHIGSSDWYINGPAVTDSVTNFLVYKVQYLTTGDIITFYLNPTPGVAPTTATGTLTLPATATLPVNASMILWAGNTNTTVTFDEIRIGTSYAAVAPDPLAAMPVPSYATMSIPTPAFSMNRPLQFHSTLAGAPISTASIDLNPTVAPATYHYQDDSLSSPDDVIDSPDPSIQITGDDTLENRQA